MPTRASFMFIATTLFLFTLLTGCGQSTTSWPEEGHKTPSPKSNEFLYESPFTFELPSGWEVVKRGTTPTTAYILNTDKSVSLVIKYSRQPSAEAGLASVNDRIRSEKDEFSYSNVEPKFDLKLGKLEIPTVRFNTGDGDLRFVGFIEVAETMLEVLITTQQDNIDADAHDLGTIIASTKLREEMKRYLVIDEMPDDVPTMSIPEYLRVDIRLEQEIVLPEAGVAFSCPDSFEEMKRDDTGVVLFSKEYPVLLWFQKTDAKPDIRFEKLVIERRNKSLGTSFSSALRVAPEQFRYQGMEVAVWQVLDDGYKPALNLLVRNDAEAFFVHLIFGELGAWPEDDRHKLSDDEFVLAYQILKSVRFVEEEE